MGFAKTYIESVLRARRWFENRDANTVYATHKKGRLKSFQTAYGENSNSGTDADRQVGSGRQAVIQDWF